MKEVLNKFIDWFFQRGDARGAAALRIAFGVIYLFMLADLYPVMDLLLGHVGMYGTMEKSFINLSHPFSLLFRYNLPWQLQLWFWSSVFFCIAVILGLMTRASILLTFLSLILFQTRGPHLVYGTDKVLLLCALWLLFLDCSRRWSLDQRIRKYRGKKIFTEIELWPIKAIQIQVALIYLYSGLAKLSTETWRDGSAVYYALQIRNFGWMESLDLTQYKAILVAATYYTLIAEISFAFLVFWKKTRIYALSAVFALHIGIDLLTRIRFFSLTMYMGYLAFILPSEWEWFATKGRSFVHFLLQKLQGRAQATS